MGSMKPSYLFAKTLLLISTSILALSCIQASAECPDCRIRQGEKNPYAAKFYQLPESFNHKGGIYENLNVRFGICYKHADGDDLKLDICYPNTPAPDGGYPIIVYFHGGGWTGGERFSGYGFFNDEIRYYNSKGIAVATVTYRFSRWANPRRTMEACVIDAKDALRFLAKNAKNLDINANKMGVYGHSAGGHLTLMLALTPDDAFEGDPALKGYAPKIVCAVPQSAPTSLIDEEVDLSKSSHVYDDNKMYMPLNGKISETYELRKRMSPVVYLKKNTPKLLLLQGARDSIVPAQAATFFKKKADEVGADVEVVISENAEHSFEDARKPDNTELANIRRAFFVKNLAPEK